MKSSVMLVICLCMWIVAAQDSLLLPAATMEPTPDDDAESGSGMDMISDLFQSFTSTVEATSVQPASSAIIRTTVIKATSAIIPTSTTPVVPSATPTVVGSYIMVIEPQEILASELEAVTLTVHTSIAVIMSVGVSQIFNVLITNSQPSRRQADTISFDAVEFSLRTFSEETLQMIEQNARNLIDSGTVQLKISENQTATVISLGFPPTVRTSEDDGLSSGAITGIVIALLVVALVLLVTVLALAYYCRQKVHSKSYEFEVEDSPTREFQYKEVPQYTVRRAAAKSATPPTYGNDYLTTTFEWRSQFSLGQHSSSSSGVIRRSPSHDSIEDTAL